MRDERDIRDLLGLSEQMKGNIGEALAGRVVVDQTIAVLKWVLKEND